MMANLANLLVDIDVATSFDAIPLYNPKAPLTSPLPTGNPSKQLRILASARQTNFGARGAGSNATALVIVSVIAPEGVAMRSTSAVSVLSVKPPGTVLDSR